MSRIRSIHPGIWTDEAFVSLSGFARLMFIGLWNECDDKGTFQWSPLQMKMRILPADNVNAAELLSEIEAAGCIMQYEIGGKKYGAVRNFCKFQRPKKPNSIHPISEQAAAFAGYNGEAVTHQFPTSGEKSPQMEDGGGNSSSVSNETALIDPEKVMFDSGVALLASCGKSEGAARSWLGKAKKQYGPEAVITMIGRAKREGTPDPIAFMEGGLRAAARARASPEFASPC